MALPTDLVFRGDEFIISDRGFNDDVAIAELVDGRFISVRVVWEDTSISTLVRYRILAQFYDIDGSRDGSEFTIALKEHDTTQGSISGSFLVDNPAVVGLQDGGFAVSWREQDSDRKSPDSFAISVENSIKAQVYDEDGSKRNNEFTVYSQDGSSVPWIVELTPYGDGFFAAWRDRSDDASDEWSQGILVRAFNKNGSPVAKGVLDDDPQYFNDERDNHQNSPASATLTDGSVVVAYLDQGGEGGGDIRIKILAENGSVLVPEFIGHQTTAGYQSDPSLAALADGRFAVMARSPTLTGTNGFFVQMFELDKSGAGTKALAYGEPILITQTGGDILGIADTAIVGTAGSGFFVSWIERRAGPEGTSIWDHRLMGQFYNADGTRRGDEILIDQGHFGLSAWVDAVEGDKGSIFLSWTEGVTQDGGFSYTGETKGRFLVAPVEAGEIDPITGTPKADKLKGTEGDDVIYGLAANDVLKGLAGDDELIGGKGADKLYGGAGADVFVFETGDSGKKKAKADTIYDFTKDDLIDLSGWDANSKKGGDQDFKFIGTADFHGKAGELRYTKTKSDTWIEGDTNGDGKADFLIRLDDPFKLKAGDFEL